MIHSNDKSYSLNTVHLLTIGYFRCMVHFHFLGLINYSWFTCTSNVYSFYLVHFLLAYYFLVFGSLKNQMDFFFCTVHFVIVGFFIYNGTLIKNWFLICYSSFLGNRFLNHTDSLKKTGSLCSNCSLSFCRFLNNLDSLKKIGFLLILGSLEDICIYFFI